MKGLVLANFKHVRKVHNSFARKVEMSDVDLNLADIAKRKVRNSNTTGDEDPQEEIFHFIAYVHVGDALYELDGLRRQPVRLSKCFIHITHTQLILTQQNRRMPQRRMAHPRWPSSSRTNI
jgi:ubiquitin carboxyl-terminal hydrolase L5